MAATREAINELSDLRLSFRIAYADITLGEELGRGGFGVVKAGRWKYNQVAVKQFNLARPSADALSEFQREAKLMMQLRSPNIVRLYGICQEIPYALVMEYMEGGSLYGLLQSSVPLDWQRRQRIALDISRGLAYLHSERILHRDLKSLNVLLDHSGQAKLCDFGLSTLKNESSSLATYSVRGSLPWMAPELFSDDPKTTTKADIYAYGMVLWELSTRQTPFAGKSPASIMARILTGKREDIPPDCPIDFAQLIRRCWEAAQDNRPDAQQTILELERLITATPIAPTSVSAALSDADITSAYRDNFNSLISSVPRPYPARRPYASDGHAPHDALPAHSLTRAASPTASPRSAGLFGRAMSGEGGRSGRTLLPSYEPRDYFGPHAPSGAGSGGTTAALIAAASRGDDSARSQLDYLWRVHHP